MRLAIYARVSTTDQDCTQQLTALRQYAGARGWTVAGEYVDTGISGAKNQRPALDRLMAAARQRQIDAIACWKIDRWGRSMPHFVNSVQELHSLGVRFIAVTQNLDTDASNPTSRLMLNLLAAFAEFERELICERVKAGLDRVRANGTKSGKAIGRPRLVVSRAKVQKLHEQSRSLREVGAKLGISAASVLRILQAKPTSVSDHRREAPVGPECSASMPSGNIFRNSEDGQ